jgi:hypothetical protein
MSGIVGKETRNVQTKHRHQAQRGYLFTFLAVGTLGAKEVAAMVEPDESVRFFDLKYFLKGSGFKPLRFAVGALSRSFLFAVFSSFLTRSRAWAFIEYSATSAAPNRVSSLSPFVG